jgi:glutaminyl-tRNA synthetase
LYDRLFVDEAPDSHKEKDFLEFVNPDSLKVVTGYVEPSLATAKNEDKFQFQRLGYFAVDKDSSAEKLVFNKTVGLKDAWEEKGKKEENSINNSLKEINKYFKVDSEVERNAVEKMIGESIASIANFSLLQNALKKNIANNKSSLLFANFMLKHSDKIKPSDFDTETIHKLYSMSIKSESPFVRFETIKILINDKTNFENLKPQVEDLKKTEKSELVLSLLNSL